MYQKKKKEYSDEGSRFSAINENDKAGSLWIVTILGLIYSSAAAVIRIRLKWGGFGLDDLFFGIAMVIFHSAVPHTPRMLFGISIDQSVVTRSSSSYNSPLYSQASRGVSPEHTLLPTKSNGKRLDR